MPSRAASAEVYVLWTHTGRSTQHGHDAPAYAQHTNRLPHHKEQHSSHGSDCATAVVRTSALLTLPLRWHMCNAPVRSLSRHHPLPRERPLSRRLGHVSSAQHTPVKCACRAPADVWSLRVLLKDALAPRVPLRQLALRHTRGDSTAAESPSSVARHNPIPRNLPGGRAEASFRLEARALRASTEIPAWRHRRAGSGWPRLEPLMACRRHCGSVDMREPLRQLALPPFFPRCPHSTESPKHALPTCQD